VIGSRVSFDGIATGVTALPRQRRVTSPCPRRIPRSVTAAVHADRLCRSWRPARLTGFMRAARPGPPAGTGSAWRPRRAAPYERFRSPRRPGRGARAGRRSLHAADT